MNKKLSSLTERFFDQHIISEYPDLVQFFRIVFQYLEEDDNIFDLILNFIDRFANIDTLKNSSNEIDLMIKDLYIEQYISQFPLYRLEDIDTIKLIKNAKDFYSIKGTEKSYNFIFSLLNHLGAFSFYYPAVDILVISDYENGVLNDDKYIHDNYYYAHYTYEIQSTLFGYFELKDIIKEIVHPVGCKTFFLRILQDTVEADSVEEIESILFVLQDTVIQYTTDVDVYDITYADVETISDEYILSLLDIDELYDLIYTLENPGYDFYEFQMDFQFTLL